MYLAQPQGQMTDQSGAVTFVRKYDPYYGVVTQQVAALSPRMGGIRARWANQWVNVFVGKVLQPSRW